MSTLGVDLGTSGVRAVAFDERGREIAAQVTRTTLDRGAHGLVTVDVEAVLLAAEASVGAVARRAVVLGDPVRALSFSVQGEAVVPVDHRGRAVSAAPVSMDARGAAAAGRMATRLGPERVQQLSGQPLHRMFSIYKIAAGDTNWRPPHAVGYRCLGEFVAMRWGGDPAIDWTSAARTGMFDVAETAWSTEIAAAAAEDAPWLAELGLAQPVPSGTALGAVDSATAARLGLGSNTLLVAGMHDQAASFLGAGGRSGKVSVFAFGSSDCLTVGTPARPEGLAGTGFATYPFAPGHWVTLAGTAAGGWALEWYAELTGSGPSTFGDLLEQAAPDPPPLLVLPYLAGSGTFDNDPRATGVIAGLTLDTTRPQLTRAFLESAGYELGVIADALAQTGIEVGEVRAVGTGAANLTALAIRAAAAGLDLTQTSGFASARGAALLAGVGVGDFDIDDLPPADVGPVVPADPHSQDWYANQRVSYRELYHAVRPISDRLTTTGRTPE